MRTLAASAKSAPDGTLDAITVWWDGKGWACIDGHHRLDAYRQVGTDKGDVIRVEVFEGTLEAALARAAATNTRNKLQMSNAERSNAAWRIVAATSLSKSAQAQAAGVSERLVAMMRAAKKSLEDGGNSDLMDMRWETARKLARGESAAEGGWTDDVLEQKASQLAVRLSKAVGPHAGHQVEIFARALEMYNSQLPRNLAEYWQEEGEEDLDSELA